MLIKKERRTMENSLLGLIEEDVATPKLPTTADLSTLTGLIKEMTVLDNRIAKGEELLKKLKEEREQISANLVPTLFTQMELTSLTVAGFEVSVSKKLCPSITEENKQTVYRWLDANGHGSIVKKVLGVKVKKGERLTQEVIEKALATFAWAESSELTEGIHHKTLEAFVNEQIKKGAKLPEEIAIFEKIETKLKEKK